MSAKKENIYGWITPSKQVIECQAFNHFSIINSPEFAEHFPEIKTKEDWEERDRELYEEDRDYFVEGLEPDQHPGWHNFYPRTFIDLLAKNRFYRFGTFDNSKQLKVIEIEGISPSEASGWKDFVRKNFVVDMLAVRGYRQMNYYKV